jgi:hypothetical protein
MAERDWNRWAIAILKSELKRKSMSYRDLAEKLESVGVTDSERNITNKINRGTFTAAFMLQCLSAIGSKSIRLEDD